MIGKAASLCYRINIYFKSAFINYGDYKHSMKKLSSGKVAIEALNSEVRRNAKLNPSNNSRRIPKNVLLLHIGRQTF